MPRPLPDELLEEVLRRLPPQEPAGLVRAALVSRRWCRLIFDPGFRRRFREFHRSPPMLGILCNIDDRIDTAQFIPTTAFCTPRTDFRDMRVLDARHGRILLGGNSNVLVVWDPITDKVRELPFPKKKSITWTAVVLCSAAGACNHLDCHQGSFLVVFVCSNKHGKAGVYNYSSDAATWSEPAFCTQQPYYLVSPWMGGALVGNNFYFGDVMGSTALKYDLDLCQVSLILLPSLPQRTLRDSLLTTTKDGGLGLVNKDDSKLYMWSRKDNSELDAKWERRVIELTTLFPVDVDVIGSGIGIIFMTTGDEIYTIDLKTYEVKKVHEDKALKVIPYMSFYTLGTTSFFGVQVAHVRDKPKD